MNRIKRYCLASRIEYLSPKDCDSTLGYKITGRKYLEAQMGLADCNRKIEWYFNPDNDGLEKIDTILSIMTEFRAEFLKAKNTWKRRKRRGKK